MRDALALLAAVLIAFVPSQAREPASSRVDTACQSAMGPYYAALLASARGDSDGTLRHLIVLRSRWEEVLRRPAADAPPWFHDIVKGQPVGAAVAARIESARQHLPADVAGAHVELESVRALLRDARTRHAARTPDDAVTDYHEAMERLSSHIGAVNEIALTATDFVAIRDDVGRAHATWTDVDSSLDLKHAGSGSQEVSAATMNVLNTIAKAANEHDATTAQHASRELRSRYFELLTILSRRQ